MCAFTVKGTADLLCMVLPVDALQSERCVHCVGIRTSVPTLVVALGLGHVDGQLAAEGVHSHHAVGGSVGERRDLVVVAGNAVERLGDVGRPLQDDLLGEDTDKRDVRKRVGMRCVDPSTAEVPTSL